MCTYVFIYKNTYIYMYLYTYTYIYVYASLSLSRGVPCSCRGGPQFPNRGPEQPLSTTLPPSAHPRPVLETPIFKLQIRQIWRGCPEQPLSATAPSLCASATEE